MSDKSDSDGEFLNDTENSDSRPDSEPGADTDKKTLRERLNVRAKRIKLALPAVYLSLRDRETPVMAKIFAAATVCYALSPIDLIPDFIPVLGYLDDLLLLPLLITLTVKLIPRGVFVKNEALAREMDIAEPEKKWKFALPIILFYVLIIAVIIVAIVT